MKNRDRLEILSFINKVIEGNDIEYQYKVKDEILSILTTEGCRYNFKIIKNNIHFYSSNKKYELANKKLFLDEMMSQFQYMLIKED